MRRGQRSAAPVPVVREPGNDRAGDEPVTVFLLHGLGLAADAFDPLTERLGPELDAVPVDLPGFGDADPSGLSVSEMVDAVLEVVARRAGPRWLLVGHSMGGKVATLVASAALSGRASVFGLAGVVLLAASPPSPEPMPDQQRADMLSWASGDSLDPRAARAFVDANVAAPLPEALDALALDDVRRSSPQAWRAWLEHGSREDWSDRVGVLDLPALILAGGDDPTLGPEAQRLLNVPVYPRAEVRVLEGPRHFLPLERPEEVADALSAFWRERAGLGPSVPAPFAELIASGRVSGRTRSTLAARALADDPAYAPSALDDVGLAVLRAVADRVVPRDDGIDLAARVDATLARGQGDGWRFDDLPPDREAYAVGLAALRALPQVGRDAQDELLARLARGELADSGALSGAQLARWFEDVRSDLVREWVGHPATMARLGYDGFATGGDDASRLSGFALQSADEHEPWEPVGAPRTGSSP